MYVVVSCHFDTVFTHPYARITGGHITGACDNIAGVLAVSQLIDDPDIDIQLTEEEELHMDGARYVAKRHSQEDTFMLVVEVTNRGRNWNKVNFTVENWAGIKGVTIKKILKDFAGKYRMKENGDESEAWLYKELGFSCLEICIPVAGGLHSLEGKARLEDIQVAAQAIRTVANYLKDKSRSDISDIYKVTAD